MCWNFGKADGDYKLEGDAPKDALVKLSETTAKLNEATEKINKQLEQWEIKLKAISPGLVTWIQDGTTKFGYYRFKDAWHLAVKCEDEEPQPILQSARWYRFALLKRMPLILEAITSHADAMADRMQKFLGGEIG